MRLRIVCVLTAGTPAGGGRRTPADGKRVDTPAGGGQADTPAGAMLQGIHAYAMGEGGYGGSPIGKAGRFINNSSTQSTVLCCELYAVLARCACTAVM